jgi:hypothetical protein
MTSLTVPCAFCKQEMPITEVRPFCMGDKGYCEPCCSPCFEQLVEAIERCAEGEREFGAESDAIQAWMRRQPELDNYWPRVADIIPPVGDDVLCVIWRTESSPTERSAIAEAWARLRSGGTVQHKRR